MAGYDQEWDKVMDLKTSLYRLYHRHISKTKHRVVAVQNAEFLIQPDNYIGRRLWVEGGYEQDRLDWLIPRLIDHNFDLCLDVGANFGLYTVLLALHTDIPAIHAFEPDPRNLTYLRMHQFMNHLGERVQIHPVAISDQTGEVSLHMAPEKSTGRSSLLERSENKEQVTVPVRRLDDLFPVREQKIMMKIDVEGLEAHVFRGASALLQQNNVLIQVESHEGEAKGIAKTSGLRLCHQIGPDYFFTNIDNLT